jgi:hypothetical protein
MSDSHNYDYWNGVRENDTAATSFAYDARPLMPGEPGAGFVPEPVAPCTCPEDLKEFCLFEEPCK